MCTEITDFMAAIAGAGKQHIVSDYYRGTDPVDCPALPPHCPTRGQAQQMGQPYGRIQSYTDTNPDHRWVLSSRYVFLHKLCTSPRGLRRHGPGDTATCTKGMNETMSCNAGMHCPSSLQVLLNGCAAKPLQAPRRKELAAADTLAGTGQLTPAVPSATDLVVHPTSACPPASHTLTTA